MIDLTPVEAEYGEPMTVIATGGLAPLFAGGTTLIRHVDPDMTLLGLMDLAERNPSLGRRGA